MAYSLMVLVSDGSLSEIPITIEYLEREHLSVSVNEAILPANGYSYVWSGDNVVTISPPVATSSVVSIKRTTPSNAALHDFQAGAVFSEVSVDENFTQDLYLLQEAREQSIVTDIYNNLNMHGYKITNIAPAVASGDVPNLGQVAAMINGGAGTGNGVFFTTFVATEGQTAATLNVPVAPGTVPMLFRRGVYQQYGESGAYVTDPLNQQTLLFNSPLSEGDSIQVIIMSGAEAISKGNRTVFIFSNGPVPPATPVGNSPSGWVLYPEPPLLGEVTYVSLADVDGSTGDLLGAWSAPVQFTGQAGVSGTDGVDGASVFDVEQVSATATDTTYRFALTNGTFTSVFQVANGYSVQSLELVGKVGKVATYRFLLSSGSYTNTFTVMDGLDGTGSVSSVAGVLPDLAGDVPLTYADIGADPAGAGLAAVTTHTALTDPHPQYDYRWLTSTDNTGDIAGSTRCRWLVDTTATRNRTIGVAVTDLLVKDITGQAGTNNVTITAPAGKTINGAATETLDANFGWVQYTLVGADFKTIGGQ